MSIGGGATTEETGDMFYEVDHVFVHPISS